MERHRVKPGSRVNLTKLDPEDTSGFKGGKKQGRDRLEKLNLQLEELQETLYAEHKHKVLVVLQAMDTGGKDGAIRKVFEGVNPQGVRVASFKAPTPEELDHDYLWRVHRHTPGKGEIVIFNRSHYEDVLIVRVHGLAPEKVWRKRYDQINAFEQMLAEEGTTILKFFLHISRQEQKDRLQARLDDPKKHWKFNPDDLEERKRWNDYMDAYEEVLRRTSTDCAPWYVVPANHKWYRDLVIGTAIVERLKALRIRFPEPRFDPAAISIE
jgi:PPK2 family polyphosphate:nucleotide phosphotransferase